MSKTVKTFLLREEYKNIFGTIEHIDVATFTNESAARERYAFFTKHHPSHKLYLIEATETILEGL